MSEGATVSRDVGIVNRRGLHARAAAKLVTLAEKFSAPRTANPSPPARSWA
jgi:phosphotransferase system HPr (HPr) family protein